MRFDSLEAWLAWLEKLHPKEIDLGLRRLGAVAARMGLIEPAEAPAASTKAPAASTKAPAASKNKPGANSPLTRGEPSGLATGTTSAAKIITVAGTNGKGSCVATLETLLIDAGYRVGAYTSPHLLHYCERIRIQGRAAAPGEVCAAFEKIDRARGDISLTYFEFATLAAVELFYRHGVDAMLLEVGLGGRLDAVNLWDADVAVVTSIALDHEAWLGGDRESIGREKAGIFRRGRAAICADAEPPASIAAAAAAVGAQLLQLGREFAIQTGGATWSWRGRSLSGEAVDLPDLPPPGLPLPSVAAALQACRCLGIELERERLPPLLERLSLPGRMQSIRYRGLELILDVAHNPAAAAYLAEKLRRSEVRRDLSIQPLPSLQGQPGQPTGRRAAGNPPAPSAAAKTYAIVAIMADKDRPTLLAHLHPLVDHWLAACLPGVERAAPAADLVADLSRLGAEAGEYATVAAALEEACRLASPGDRVLVFGSFLTVAAALEICGPENL